MSTRTTPNDSKSSRNAARLKLAALLCAPALVLSGCYVLPVAPDGTPIIPAGVPVALPPMPANAIQMPTVLNVRLYPANDLATPGGVLTGQVTNLMGGRGRFQFNYQGET